MHLRSSRTVRTLAVLAAVVTLAACSGDATGVKTGQVPAAAVASAATQVQTITSDPTITALLSGAVSNAMLDRSGSAAALFSRSAGTAIHFAKVPSQPRFLFGSTTTLSIPAEMRGRVYVHDSANAYVVDSAQTGPANGFRLALYAYNPNATAGQEWGTTPIGHADVTDEGATNTQKIVVNVFANGNTSAVFAFKLVTAALAGGATADTVGGTINAANGKTMTYVFADRTNGPVSATQRVTTTLEVDVPSASFQMDGSFVDGAVTTSDVQTLTTTIGADAIRFSTAMVSQQGAVVESDTTNIDVNGKAAGYVTYGGTEPQFFAPDGSAMSTETKAALLQLEGVYEQVFSIIGASALFAFWAMTLGFSVL